MKELTNALSVSVGASAAVVFMSLQRKEDSKVYMVANRGLTANIYKRCQRTCGNASQIGACMTDWYMESGDYATVNRDAGLAWSDSQSSWCEIGSTADTTPVWWRKSGLKGSRRSESQKEREELYGKRAELRVEMQQEESLRSLSFVGWVLSAVVFGFWMVGAAQLSFAELSSGWGDLIMKLLMSELLGMVPFNAIMGTLIAISEIKGQARCRKNISRIKEDLREVDRKIGALDWEEQIE